MMQTAESLAGGLISTRHLPQWRTLNPALIAAYRQHRDDADTRRSHFFAGRYENIYLPRSKLPGIEQILARAEGAARAILCLTQDTPLRSGFWVNEMNPGDVTLLHTHDDDDELLSGVYYLEVPERSGRLMLHTRGQTIPVYPEPGMFVFFPPAMPHEVTRNESGRPRLSLGINIGPGTDGAADAC